VKLILLFILISGGQKTLLSGVVYKSVLRKLRASKFQFLFYPKVDFIVVKPGFYWVRDPLHYTG